MSKNKIVELVNLWDEFEQRQPGAGIGDFCRHYLQMHESAGPPPTAEESEGIPLEGLLGRSLYRLNRFVLFYTKKLMAELPLRTLEEFVYLATIRDWGEPRKSDVIHENLSEFTSGIGVLRRLSERGFIEELDDPDDARSRRVRMTVEGMKALEACYEQLSPMSRLIWSSLTEAEMRLVHRILDKADRLHSERYRHLRNASPDEIMRRYA
jgi:DNA-binding MarR family transcriptional regulator